MPKRKPTEGVLALDLGTSSVRAVVYDPQGRMDETSLSDLPYKVQTKEPGEVSSNPDPLVELITQSIDQALKAARKQNVAIVAAATSCYWHSLVGVDKNGRPTTELLTWADTRSAAEAQQLRRTADERDYHERTGCFFHASYWPAKLRWLATTRDATVRRTARWISLGEYLYRELFGDAPVSLSMASGTGLLDVNRCQWDEDGLRLAGITAEQLSSLTDWSEPCRSLRPRFARRWPELRDIPWYLPVGDGALANVGAGAVTPQWACATIGTSSALRVILTADRLTIPWGTFVYRLDRNRFVLGGALSEGGNVVRWFTGGLGLKKKQLEREAGAVAPDSHGLTVLPFWAGERSPNWRGDARAVISGISLATQPAHLLRAAMEAISYQFVAVADAMERAMLSRPQSLIGTGGQLVHSPVWSQMLADALNMPVSISPEPEASSRGAALLALHVLGKMPRLWSTSPPRGRRYQPRERIHHIYARARQRQARLYEALVGSSDGTASGVPESGSRTTGLRTPSAKH